MSESQLGVLPVSLVGKDAIELGCGTAYVSASELETVLPLKAPGGLAFAMSRRLSAEVETDYF